MQQDQPNEDFSHDLDRQLEAIDIDNELQDIEDAYS